LRDFLFLVSFYDMPALEHLIESILFVSQKPLSLKKIAALLQAPLKEVRLAATALATRYTKENSGIVLIVHEDEYQFVTHPDASALIQNYLQEEITGELTRPALETLSVIAYRGPVKKSQVEKIRGVNCSLALRNLLLRGLVEEGEDKENMEKIYSLSFQFIHHLGVGNVGDLPEYEKLHSLQTPGETIDQV